MCMSISYAIMTATWFAAQLDQGSKTTGELTRTVISIAKTLTERTMITMNTLRRDHPLKTIKKMMMIFVMLVRNLTE